ncbi:hypothetical protein BHE74_00043116, partial [Ensete ventricosum]
YREWVRNKLDTKGVRPFHFAQTVSPFDPPCALAETSTSGNNWILYIQLYRMITFADMRQFTSSIFFSFCCENY